MRSTKIMLALIATFLITWMSLSTIFYLLSDDATFKQIATSGPIWFFLLIVGWVPCIIVGADLDKKLP